MTTEYVKLTGYSEGVEGGRFVQRGGVAEVSLPEPYYQEDGITIYHADCKDILPLLEPVDLVLTSPPYNLGNSTGGGLSEYRMGHYSPGAGLSKRGGNGKWKNPTLATGYESFNDSLPHDEYVMWQHLILNECWRLLTPDGAIYYNHKTRIFNGNAVTPLDYNPGLPLRQIVIWARAGGINFSPTFYCPTHEWILILAKPDFRLKSKGASGVGDVWYIPQEANTKHPAPFPLALAKRAIETTPAKIILDPFCGSGTTLRAAKDAGRKAIGIEVSERYCEEAARRLSQGVLSFA